MESNSNLGLNRMVTVGFDPTKRDALDLKSSPFDQARERYLKVNLSTLNYDEMILFHSELIKSTNLSPPAGFEPATYRLTAERSANWAIEDQGTTYPKMPTVGLEPTTTRLKVLRSTNWARRAIHF